MTSLAAVGRSAVVAGAVAVALAGCRGLLPVASADDFSTWSRSPLAPDPAMADRAREHPSCRAGFPEGAPVTVVIQDRRTTSSAAFLLSAPGHFGSCFISVGGSGGGSSSNVVPSLEGVLTVTEAGTATSGEGTTNALGGLSAPNARAVRVRLDDGTFVEASVLNGYWLSWWPGRAAAERVSALDPTGAVLGELVPGEDGWEPLEAAQ